MDAIHSPYSPASGRRRSVLVLRIFAYFMSIPHSCNRIIGLLIHPLRSDPPPTANPASTPFKITKNQLAQLQSSLQDFHNVIPDFKLPSLHTLNRYMTSFFETFHSYMPFVHIQTLRLEACVPEFVLAMATVGAQSRLEHRKADAMFFAAKAVVMERMRQQEREGNGKVQCVAGVTNLGTSSSRSYQSPQETDFSVAGKMPDFTKKAQIQTVRCIFLLLGYASWERPEILREAFGIRSILVRYLRRIGLREVSPTQTLNWHEWAEEECDRRIKFVAFCFLNTHSIAFDTPPVLLSSEVHIRLPCSTEEWEAPDMTAWQSVRSELPQLEYRRGLSLLLSGSDATTPLSPTPCPLGRYILMHGVLQRVFLVRELSSSMIRYVLTLSYPRIPEIRRIVDYE